MKISQPTLSVLGVALATSFLGAFAGTPSAMAAEPAPEAERRSATIEEVIVTARKTEESVQDVPVAVTAISAEQLQSPTIRNLTDLNGFAPNVTIGEDGSRGGGGASINIRGISPTRTDDNSFDAPIGVMIDGIYLGSLAGQVLENFDLERIEVLRGPQGTLFGKNTVGGVVHVIRSRPTGELGGAVQLTLGEDNQQELRFVGNAPIIEDVLAAKIFATTQTRDGWLDNETIGGQVADTDYKNYGATFLLTPNEAFEATFTIEKFDDTSELGSFHVNGNYAPGVIPPPTDPNSPNFSGGFLPCLIFGLAPTAPYPQVCRRSTETPDNAQNDTDNNAELETDAYTLNMSFDLNDHMQLVSVTGYRDMTEYRIYDFDASAAPWITIERWNDYDQFSQEFRIDSQWEDVTMTSGIYYWNSEFEQDWVTSGAFWGVLQPFLYNQTSWDKCQAGLTAPLYCDTELDGLTAPEFMTQNLYETQETTSVAMYTQADWRFMEDWTLTAGLRWTEETKDFRAGQAYMSNVERQALRNFPLYADLDNTWRELSPKLGLTYQINDSSMVYASYSEGFHSGGFFGVNQNIRDFNRDQYDPEFAYAYEIGYKSTHLDDRLLLNVTLFRNDFKDKQEASVQVDPDTNTVASVFDNVADARYQGFEIETQYVFTDYFRAFVNYGYLDAEYSDFETDVNNSDTATTTPATCPGEFIPSAGGVGGQCIQDASFLKPRNAPESTVGVGGTFSWPIGPGSLEIYGKYSWTDEFESSLLNIPQGTIDDRKDLTASIGYVTENWSVTAFGTNLTDEEIEFFGNVATLFAWGTVVRPQHFGIEATYRFSQEN